MHCPWTLQTASSHCVNTSQSIRNRGKITATAKSWFNKGSRRSRPTYVGVTFQWEQASAVMSSKESSATNYNCQLPSLPSKNTSSPHLGSQQIFNLSSFLVLKHQGFWEMGSVTLPLWRELFQCRLPLTVDHRHLSNGCRKPEGLRNPEQGSQTFSEVFLNGIILSLMHLSHNSTVRKQ